MLQKILIVLMFFALISCGKKASEKDSSIIKVEAKPSVTTLYYTGLIKPIQTVSINNAQADGVIIEKNFEYGKAVTKGQLLMVISSKQLSKNYQEALSQYLKSKKNYNDVQFQMTGAEELKKLKILSQQEYLSTKTQLFNATMDLQQSTNRLQDVLSDLGLDMATVNKLDSNDQVAIRDALNKAPTSVKIIAPKDGVALMPEDNSSKDSVKTPLMLGSPVKSGQNLLLIGDMSGIAITVKVNQVYVEKIKENQKAMITSEAFPGITLEGKVSYVGRQASTENNSGTVPTFDVNIAVPQITQTALNQIRVGMSADVAFPLETPDVIKIPIGAVFTKKGETMVEKIDGKTGKIVEAKVDTGRTEMDAVEIIQGLKSDDKVIVHATHD